MNCPDCKDKLDRFVDRELNNTEVLELQLHLEGCPDGITVEGARSVAGDRLLIGASASTPEAARQAIADGADYLGVGPAFETPVKSEKDVIGPEGVLEVAKAVGAEVPVFAIGGIDESNVQQLTRLGLHRVCVIRAIGDARDPEAAARRLRAMLES